VWKGVLKWAKSSTQMQNCTAAITLPSSRTNHQSGGTNRFTQLTQFSHFLVF
jgi:hypothetical protein